MKSYLSFFTLLLATVLLESTADPTGSNVKPFNERGIIVDIHSFFETVQAESMSGAGNDDILHRALVTRSGVYAFLENPTNQEFLKQVQPGSYVTVTGKLLTTGALLHVESMEKAEGSPEFDLENYRQAPGKPVTLEGSNKCQCGLKVDSLPSSCLLGHLHHLETPKGTIYNYLQQGSAVDLFLGKGSHFKEVRVKGKEYPGHYLLVEEVTIKN